MTRTMIPRIRSNGVRLPGTNTNSATLAATKVSRIPVANRLLTSTPASSSGSLMLPSRGSVHSLDGDGSARSRHPISFENVGDLVNVPRPRVECVGVDRGDGGPRDAAV